MEDEEQTHEHILLQATCLPSSTLSRVYFLSKTCMPTHKNAVLYEVKTNEQVHYSHQHVANRVQAGINTLFYD